MDGLKADKMFLQNQIDQLQEELKERDEAFGTLSNTLADKGQQNRKLSEALACFKNQLIADQIFDQRFNVTHMGQLTNTEYTFKFVRDKSEDGEFFLEI